MNISSQQIIGNLKDNKYLYARKLIKIIVPILTSGPIVPMTTNTGLAESYYTCL
jgi:hypothetical protein